MSYLTRLQANNTGLQACIDKANALPNAGGGGSNESETTFTYTVTKPSDAFYGFALNDNGYYESQNKGKSSSYAICRVNLEVLIPCDIIFNVINYAESQFDYALFGNLDSPLGLSSSADSDVKKSFKGESSSALKEVTYSSVSAGSHYIDIKFIKDGSQDSNNDSVQFKIRTIDLTWRGKMVRGSFTVPSSNGTYVRPISIEGLGFTPKYVILTRVGSSNLSVPTTNSPKTVLLSHWYGNAPGWESDMAQAVTSTTSGGAVTIGCDSIYSKYFAISILDDGFSLSSKTSSSNITTREFKYIALA